MKEIKILLGANSDRNLVFGEFNCNSNFLLTYSSPCMPFPVKNKKRKQELFKMNAQKIINSSDKAALYDLCCNYGCHPGTLLKKIANNTSDIRDIYDCSTFSEYYEIDGVEWYFLDRSMGQTDMSHRMAEYTNKAVYDEFHELLDFLHLRAYCELHELRDAFHLKMTENASLKKIMNFINKCELLHLDDKEFMKGWISDYICRNRKILENNEPC